MQLTRSPQAVPVRRESIMQEKLICGYTAYTTAEEYAAAARGSAPGTTPIETVVSAALGIAVSASFFKSC